MFGSVTPRDMQAVSMLAGLTMAAWLAAGMLPSLRRHATRIRGALLALYLAAGLGLLLYVVLR